MIKSYQAETALIFRRCRVETSTVTVATGWKANLSLHPPAMHQDLTGVKFSNFFNGFVSFLSAKFNLS
jgi:hypothetical protein